MHLALAPASYYGHLAVGHMVVSALIHGLIWSLVFRLLAHLSLPELVVLVVLVVGGIWLWSRNRDMRRW